MKQRTCPALVDGKECGLELILVKREIETDTDVYECPRGHQTHLPYGEMEKRKCPVLVDGKECGLELILVERELETATSIYECPRGHRTHVPLEPEAVDTS